MEEGSCLKRTKGRLNKELSPLPSARRPALPLLLVSLSSFNRNGRAFLQPVGAIAS